MPEKPSTKPAAKPLYERAVDLVRQRASVSVTNLKTALNCSDAQARSFLRVMKEEGILGAPLESLGRYPVLVAEPTRYAEDKTVINLDQPELSVLNGQDVPVEEILDADGQEFLRKVMDQLVDFEARQAEINDERRVVMEMAKLRKLSPKILRKVASALFRDKKRELITGASLTYLYLHALGELIEDEMPPAPDLEGGANGTRH